jgi:hypothetical protein
MEFTCVDEDTRMNDQFTSFSHHATSYVRWPSLHYANNSLFDFDVRSDPRADTLSEETASWRRDWPVKIQAMTLTACRRRAGDQTGGGSVLVKLRLLGFIDQKNPCGLLMPSSTEFACYLT